MKRSERQASTLIVNSEPKTSKNNGHSALLAESEAPRSWRHPGQPADHARRRFFRAAARARGPAWRERSPTPLTTSWPPTSRWRRN